MIFIRFFLIAACILAVRMTSAAQGFAWEPVSTYHAGICQDMLETPGGFLLLAGPTGHPGRMGRGLFRMSFDAKTIEDVSPSWSRIGGLLLPGDGSILCASEEALWLSLNDGRNWQKRADSLHGPFCALEKLRDGYCYALTEGGALFRSINNGRTWDTVSTALHAYVHDWGNTDFLGMNHRGWLIASTHRTPSAWFSRDSGHTWESYFVVEDSLYRRPYIYGVQTISAIDGAIIAAHGRQSPDWSSYEQTALLPSARFTVQSTDITSDGQRSHFVGIGSVRTHFYGSDGARPAPQDSMGVFVSRDDGHSWSWLARGLDAQSLQLLSDGTLLVSTLKDGFFQIDTARGSVQPLHIPYGHVSGILCSGDTVHTVLDSCHIQGTLHSYDDGSSWEWTDGATRTIHDPSPGIWKLLDSSLLRGSWPRLHLSLDNGAHWTVVLAKVYDGWERIFRMTRLAGGALLGASLIQPRDSSSDCTLYVLDDSLTELAHFAATGMGQIFDLLALEDGSVLAAADSGVFRSTNQGQSWTRKSTGLHTRLVAHDGGRFLAGGVGSYMYSDDGGKQWSIIPVAENVLVHDLLERAGKIFYAAAGAWSALGTPLAGNAYGLLFGSVTVPDWTTISADLPTHEITALAVDARGVLWVGTRGCGLYRSSHSVLEAPARQYPRPDDISMEVYPNPVRDRATILLDAEHGAHISLRLYDALGRHVKTIAEDLALHGSKQLRFSCGQLPAGLYFLRVHGEGRTHITPVWVNPAPGR